MNFIDYFCIVNHRQREIKFARACMVRHAPCNIRSICFTSLTDIGVKGTKTLQYIYFSMPRIPNNLRERVIGMLDAGMSTEHVARHVGYSSRAIRNLRITFRTTRSTNDLPRRGCPRDTKQSIPNSHCYCC